MPFTFCLHDGIFCYNTILIPVLLKLLGSKAGPTTSLLQNTKQKYVWNYSIILYFSVFYIQSTIQTLYSFNRTKVVLLLPIKSPTPLKIVNK